MAKTEDKAYVDFLFTEDGFILDTTSFMALDEDGKERFLIYEKDRFTALYEYTLAKKEGEILSPSETYLQLVADSFFKNLRALSELELLRDQVVVTMTDYERDGLLDRLPFVPGSSYVDASWLMKLYDNLKLVFEREIKAYKGSVRQYFTEKNSMIQMPERIFFHLVENRKDEDYPFAFAATYAIKTEEGKVKHVALRYALTEFKADREKLVSFLACLNKAAEVSSLIAEFMERGELFHTLRLTSKEAYQFLKDIEAIESVGILCRIPNWWRSRSSSVSLSVRLGEKKESLLGLNSLLKTSPALVVDGVPLSKEEIKSLLAQTEGLALIKGKWVEVDHDKLRKLLDQMKHVPKSMSLLDALRSEIIPAGTDDVYGRVSNGAFLQSILSELRNPASKKEVFAVPKSFQAKLRPYQIHGYGWLMSMSRLGLGACIADDMGLGKTIQVLAYQSRILIGLRKNSLNQIKPFAARVSALP